MISSNTAVLSGLLAMLVSLSCTTPPEGENGDRRRSGRYSMAGYEFSSRSGDDTRPSIIERFGPPLAEERAGSPPDYHILSYPIAGESERLLLLFHDDDLLGVFQESAQSAMKSTIQSHQRSQSGRVVLLQLQFEMEKPIYFTATRDQLSRVPQWKPGDATAPPLSEAQAEAVVEEWQKNTLQVVGGAKVLRLLEVRSVPSVSFYQIALGDFRSPPQHRQVLVLMDGTLIAGDAAP